MKNCGVCHFSEMIDGILFCNELFEDVELDNICENFVYYKEYDNSE